MAVLECVLVDPHSSANCERGGRLLKRVLTSSRKSLQAPVVDSEMRIGMNGPHERNLEWSFFSNRWFNVLSKASPIARDIRGSRVSRVVTKQIDEATSKTRLALQCSFYSTITHRQNAKDSNSNLQFCCKYSIFK